LFDAFRQGLRDLGYVDEKNVLIERRYAEGRLDRMSPFVQEFVQQKVDVILGTSNVVIRAAREATKTTPIVMISSVDPVAAGYVESFAHPGGNISGLAWLSRDLSAKRVELLRELLPKMSRVGILWDADAPGPKVAFKEYTAASRAFNLDLRSIEVRGTNPDFVAAFPAARVGRPMASDPHGEQGRDRAARLLGHARFPGVHTRAGRTEHGPAVLVEDQVPDPPSLDRIGLVGGGERAGRHASIVRAAPTSCKGAGAAAG